MIDINTYRIRIGCFNQKVQNRKVLYKADNSSKSTDEETSIKVGNAINQIWRKVWIICLLFFASLVLHQEWEVDRMLISAAALTYQEGGSTTRCQSMMEVGPKSEKKSKSNSLLGSRKFLGQIFTWEHNRKERHQK